MTDWRLAGQKADATRISTVLRSHFGGDNKQVVRDTVVDYLSARGVERPIDLWGGGLSAELMVKASMRPIVIDDGRAASLVSEDLGQKVSRERFLRAMRLSGEIAGYETRSGPIVKHAPDADGAFLDLCGHWSPQVERALRHCRHMKALAITLMPERTPLGRLSIANWQVAYTALLKDATWMVPDMIRSYVRNGYGQRAMVFLLRPIKYRPDYRPSYRPRWEPRSKFVVSPIPMEPARSSKEANAAYMREYRKREHRQRSEVLERQAEYQRRYVSRVGVDEYKARKAEADRERRAKREAA